jgi:hypothetical protein
VSLAYLILAHQAPEQVARLVGRISTPDDVVLVHVDRRSDIAAFRKAFARLPIRPVLVTRRSAVHWGGYGIVTATLAGMRQALALELPWSHLLLLSGSDYPIRSTAEIHAFFAQNPGRSFLSWSAGESDTYTDADRRGNETWRWTGDRSRLLTWCVSIRGARWNRLPDEAWFVPPRRIPRGLTPYQGSAWFNLSREAVAHSLRSLRRRPGVRLFFRFVFAPDENVFQMLLLASPLRDTLVNEDLRFMHWAGNSPPLLEVADVPDMLASRKLFARKFDLAADPAPFDALDRAAGVDAASTGTG